MAAPWGGIRRPAVRPPLADLDPGSPVRFRSHLLSRRQGPGVRSQASVPLGASLHAPAAATCGRGHGMDHGG